MIKSERESAARVALFAYTKEPCRICGELITQSDLPDLVYAGYGKRGRSAHGRCWNKLQRDWGQAETVVAVIDTLEANDFVLRSIRVSFKDGKRRARRMRHGNQFAIFKPEQ